MANDNVSKVLQTVDGKLDVKAGKTGNARAAIRMEQREIDNADEKNWEWVTIPAKDLFGETHNGISINFQRFGPEMDDNGNPTGNEGRHFVNPEIAKEIRRLLDNYLRSDMRVLQPGQDKKMLEIQGRRGGKFVSQRPEDAEAIR